MNAANDDTTIEKRAKRRVAMKLGFYTHALVYVLVNLALYAINQTMGGVRWSIWPALGWGIGLTVHGIVTFVSLQGEGMRSRMVQREIERMRRPER